jgi:hypothetical protein
LENSFFLTKKETSKEGRMAARAGDCMKSSFLLNQNREREAQQKTEMKK